MSNRIDIRRRKKTRVNTRLCQALRRGGEIPNFVALIESRERGIDIELSGYELWEAVRVLERAAQSLRQYGSTSEIA